MMARERRVLAAFLVAVVTPAACSDSATGADADAFRCTEVWCERFCEARHGCNPTCSETQCWCRLACGSDARDDAGSSDADAESAEWTDSDAAGGDGGDGRSEDGPGEGGDGRDYADADRDCLYRGGTESRAGASPGVTCRRVSLPEVEHALLFAAGDLDRVVFSSTGSRVERRRHLWEYRRSTGCIRVLDDLADADVLRGYWAVIWDPSVDGALVAYGTSWDVSAGVQRCQVRLVDTGTGTRRILDDNTSALTGSGGGRACASDHLSLDHPWLAWRDVREADLYRWYVLAMNVETGERRNLSVDPPDGGPYWSAVRVDLLDTTVVWGGVGSEARQKVVTADVVTGERRVVSEDLSSRWFATITPEWLAWVDQRNHPECWWFSPCSADIYGYNRLTGEEQPLVIAGDTMQGDEVDGEGPWLVYEDQRGGRDPTDDMDREEDIFALHLPTMTEIRITDWPGYEMLPRAYERGDGAFGVLLLFEIDRWSGTNSLWDCDLPEP